MYYEDAIFQMPTSWKHSVHEELRRFIKEISTTGTQRLTERWKKRVDCEGDFMEKFVNPVPMVYAKLIIIVLEFSEKNMSNYYFICIYR